MESKILSLQSEYQKKYSEAYKAKEREKRYKIYKAMYKHMREDSSLECKVLPMSYGLDRVRRLSKLRNDEEYKG